MRDFDDFGELYADLEDRDIGIAREVEEEEGDKNEIEEKGAVGSCSSSDSEDDLQIVLNEEDYSNKPPFQLITAGRDCEENEGDDLVNVTGRDCYWKKLKIPELGQPVDGLQRLNRERGNSTKRARRNSLISCSPGSALRPWNPLSGRGHLDHLTVPCSFGNSSYSLGFPMAFPNGYDFYLPRNRNIFNIDLESFECKPWTFNGVDITDYFNFGLDEEGWSTYCKQLVHLQPNKLPSLHSSKLNKPTGTTSGEVAQHAHDKELEILNYHHNEGKGIRMPKGRAIQVESGNGDRIPSIDVRRPRNMDSDVVIQITTGLDVEDALDPIIDRITNVDDNLSKSEILSNSSEELRKSSFSVFTCAHQCEGSVTPNERPNPFMEKHCDEKLDNVTSGRNSTPRGSLIKPDGVVADRYCSSSNSSYHNGSFEASGDDEILEKVPSPECIQLNSDSQFQESVLSDYFLTDETGSDSSKIDHRICGGDSPESLLDLNYSQQATPHEIVKLNLSSDDGMASPSLHGHKDDMKYQWKDIDTIVRKWDDEPNERRHSSQGGSISPRNNIKENKAKTLKSTAFLAGLMVHYEGPSPVINREERSTASEFKMKRNDCYVNQRSQHNSRIQNDVVNRSYLQSNSRNIPLYGRRGCHTSRRADEHDMLMDSHYSTMEAKRSPRERSLNESRERPLDGFRERSLNGYRERSLYDYREKTLDEYFEMGLPHIHEEERFINKCERVPCSAGASRRFHETHIYEKNQLKNFECSSKYADHRENPRLYKGRLHRRLCRNSYDADGTGLHDDDSPRNKVPSLFKPDKRYMSRSGFSRPKETFHSTSNKRRIVSSEVCHNFSSGTSFHFDRDKAAQGRAVYTYNSACNERRKGNWSLPEILDKEEVSFRLKDSNNFSSPNSRTLYGIVHHQNVRADKNSFSNQKVSGNHVHSSAGNEFNVRSGKDSDSCGRFGSLSVDFVKNRHDLDIGCCRKAVSKHLKGWKFKSKGRCTTRDSNDAEECSNCKTKMTRSHLCPEKEVEELEEGQLVEELDGKTQMDLAYPGPKIKLIQGYDRKHLLESLAKMEKRRERFKDPILPKKVPENCGDMQPDTSSKDEVKPPRPLRKRQWCGS